MDPREYIDRFETPNGPAPKDEPLQFFTDESRIENEIQNLERRRARLAAHLEEIRLAHDAVEVFGIADAKALVPLICEENADERRFRVVADWLNKNKFIGQPGQAPIADLRAGIERGVFAVDEKIQSLIVALSSLRPEDRREDLVFRYWSKDEKRFIAPAVNDAEREAVQKRNTIFGRSMAALVSGQFIASILYLTNERNKLQTEPGISLADLLEVHPYFSPFVYFDHDRNELAFRPDRRLFFKGKELEKIFDEAPALRMQPGALAPLLAKLAQDGTT